MRRTRAEHILFEGGGMVLSRFDCPPDHPAWTRTNATGRWPLVAFPGTPVWIEHDGGPPFVADPTVAVLYAPGQEYGRRLLDPAGDHCTVIGLDEALLFDMMRAGDGPDRDRAFASSRVTVPGRVRLAHRSVLWALGADAPPDPLWVQETLLLEVGAVVRAMSPGVPRPATTRGRELASRRAAVEEAKAVLVRRFRERLTLEEIARAVHVSQYHLARMFRSETGTTIHRHLTDLRLRAALDAMDPSGGDLSRVAADVGFAHHSHLTALFTRGFGVPPSRARLRGPVPRKENRAGS